MPSLPHQKLKALAPTEAAGTVLPTALDERRKGLIDNLNAASAGDFDRVWLTQQVAAHNEALTLLNGYKDTAATPGLAGLDVPDPYAGDAEER